MIQTILFPDQKYSIAPELFFQGTYDGSISAGSTVSLESYFNAFSIGKWREYTILDNLSLQLMVEGDIEIKAYHSAGTLDEELLQKGCGKLSESEYIDLVNTEGYRAERAEIRVSVSRTDNIYTVSFIDLPEDGVLYVTVKALSDAKLMGGGYCTRVDESLLAPVRLAIGICTFKREEFVRHNINCLKSDLMDNVDSPLHSRLEVYISDNGQTLDRASFDDEKVHLFQNPNLGGSGGFTRTMIEAMFHDKAKGFTHIIFMDDDILLYPPVLERTYSLLRMLRAEYKKAILGGGMLLLDRPYMQHAVGALYKRTESNVAKASHKFFDLRNQDAISANEVISPTNHTGWWYACIPQSIIDKNNLPMPYFIHLDDVEYGLRNIDNREIYINGICVWHPSPRNKEPLWMRYYDVRNRLITMFSSSLSKTDLKQYIVDLTKSFSFNILRYDYEKAQLMLMAMHDFLKGPEDFISKDALKLHARLSEFKQKNLTPGEVAVDISEMVTNMHHNFAVAGIEQILCNLLPCKDKICAIAMGTHNIPYRARRLYIYNEKAGNGYLLERNRMLFFKQLSDYIKTILKLSYNYRSLLAEWQKAKPTLTSLSFWEKYLNLSSKEIEAECI